ncbi:MAG: hypothetical protein ACRELB_09650, partial [Polyangiaceae bacterium]
PERLEVVQRDVVVEPWDQWHRRRGGHVVTWWRTPTGELVASRVAAPPRSNDGPRVCETLLRAYRDELRAALARYQPDLPGGKPLVLLRSQRDGDEIEVMDRQWAEMALEDYPTIVAALGGARPGFAPIVVDTLSNAALEWCPVGALDVATPPRVHAQDSTPSRPDYHDVVFDDPPAAALARVPAWAMRLQVVWWALATLAFCAGYLGIVEMMIVLCVLPTRGPRAEEVLGVIAPVTALLWVYLVGLLLQPRRAREPRPAPRRRTRLPGRRYWMNCLSKRLSGLERLVDLAAPEPIVEDSRRMVRDAIAELPAADAEAVLRAWPRAAKMLGGSGPAQQRPEERPN